MVLTWMLWMWAHSAVTSPVPSPPSVLPTAPSTTPDVIEQRPEGSVNWSHHLWRVRGQSLPVSPALSFGGPIRQAGGALALARTDAQARLSALSQTMFWGPPEVADAKLVGTPSGASGAAGRWGEGHNIATQFFSDGHVTVTQDFSWDRPMAEALWQARQIAQNARAHASAHAPAHSSTADAPDVLVQIPTGLVINARGLRARPALLPEVRDEAGVVLFDVGQVHPEALSRHGVARFSHSLDAAVKDDRMGAHPAVVRAHATAPDAPWSLVVDARQAAMVQAAQPALARARVIIVIDEPARPPPGSDATVHSQD